MNPNELSPPVAEAIEQLATMFAARFPTTVSLPRIVGREAEYPIVDREGRAADVRRLWPLLLAGGDLTPTYDSHDPKLIVGLAGSDYSYALEVGLGTVEINTRPVSDLHQTATIMTRAMARLVEAAATLDLKILGYGIQPLSPVEHTLMSPKQRYESLYTAMGDEWLWYAVTASDQVQIDIARHEVLEMLNYGNLIAPIIIAFCGNSPIYEGHLSRYCSGREGRMAAIHAEEFRHGMPARPYRSLTEYVATVSQTSYLIRRDQGDVVPDGAPFTDYLAEHGADFEAFLFHEHYLWNSARVRVAYGTVEIRPACQQPWLEQMAATALGVGLVEAKDAVTDYLRDALGKERYWATMRAYYQAAIDDGLAAAQPAPGFLDKILSLAEAGLDARGQDEAIYLVPLHQRLEVGENPAQKTRRHFQMYGLHHLLRETAIRPDPTKPATT